MAGDKRKSGRVTPPKGSSRPARPARRSIMPDRIGPFEKPDPDKPLGQVGRRPSSPTKLLVFGMVYLACGITSFFVLKGTLRVIIGIVLIGISVFWFRAAATTVLRQQARRDDT